MESSQQLEKTYLHSLVIYNNFPLERRASNTRGTMGTPAVISSQLINPPSRTVSLAIAQKQFGYRALV